MNAQTFWWSLGNRSLEVLLSAKAKGETGLARCGDRQYAYRVLQWERDGGLIDFDGRRLRFYWSTQPQGVSLWLNGEYYQLERLGPSHVVSPQPLEAIAPVIAPMPGTIIQVAVREGDQVVAQQPLLVMESMKMESILRSPKPARVTRIECAPGDVVEMGKRLMVLQELDSLSPSARNEALPILDN